MRLCKRRPWSVQTGVVGEGLPLHRTGGHPSPVPSYKALSSVFYAFNPIRNRSRQCGELAPAGSNPSPYSRGRPIAAGKRLAHGGASLLNARALRGRSLPRPKGCSGPFCWAYPSINDECATVLLIGLGARAYIRGKGHHAEARATTQSGQGPQASLCQGGPPADPSAGVVATVPLHDQARDGLAWCLRSECNRDEGSSLTRRSQCRAPVGGGVGVGSPEGIPEGWIGAAARSPTPQAIVSIVFMQGCWWPCGGKRVY